MHGDVVEVARRVAKATGCEVLLPHVCNDRGVMGAGVARRLADEFPDVDQEYRRVCRDHDNALGKVVTEHVEPHLYVMNMICQSGFHDGTLPPLRYGALVHCMEEVWHLGASHNEMGVRAAIVCPKFGAGLAGGNWEVINSLITEIWSERKFAVVICNYP